MYMCFMHLASRPRGDFSKRVIKSFVGAKNNIMAKEMASNSTEAVTSKPIPHQHPDSPTHQYKPPIAESEDKEEDDELLDYKR